MIIKGKKCPTCGHRLAVRKETTYRVRASSVRVIFASIYDAVDCPKCGCQVVLAERLEKVVTNDDNKVN